VDTDMRVGDRITVSGVAGNGAANTTAPIAAVQPMAFWYRYNPAGLRICGATNAAPIVVTTCAPHGLAPGTRVRVDQAARNTAMNGWWTVGVTDATHLILQGSAGNGVYTDNPAAYLHGPGMLARIAAQNQTCTATTTAPHNLAPSMKVLVFGSTSAALGQDEGHTSVYTIGSAPTATSFSFACPNVTDGVYDQDGDELAGPSPWLYNLLSMQVFPAIAIAGTGTGDYVSGGTLVSIEDFRNFTEIRHYPYAPGPQFPNRRLGGFPGSRAAIVLYEAPDEKTCGISLTDPVRQSTPVFVDSGGLRSRTQVLANLSPATAYDIEVDCSAGAIYGGVLETPAEGIAPTRQVRIIAATPPQAAGADNLVVDYGPDSASLVNSARATCADGRCSTAFPYSANSIVWVRRRWCRGGQADTTCASPSNELVRSTPQPIRVR
jgi:hypothetical protein